MNESQRSRYTPAGKIANERFIAAASGDGSYPDGTAFLASDAPDFAEMLAASVAEHRPVALIYPDGREVVATPAAGAFAGLLVLGLSFVSSRRRQRARLDRSGPEGSTVALPREYEVEFRVRQAVPSA